MSVSDLRFDSLIFDLDGTLWDASGACAGAFNAAYKRFGVTRRVDRDFIRSISGRPSTECDQLLMEGVDDAIRGDLQKVLDELEVVELERYAQESLYPGVEKGLQILSKHFRLFLVSNCSSDYLGAFNRKTSVSSYFEGMECYGNTGLPKAENIKLVISRFDLTAPCYIGDTRGDELAARGADVPFLYAAYGFGKVEAPACSYKSFEEMVEDLRGRSRLIAAK